MDKEPAPELQLAGGKYTVKQTLGEGAYGTVHLAETAESADEIDAQRAQASQERAQQKLMHAGEDGELTEARARLARALNRLRVAGEG